ncbi:hypothetical protein O1611_g1546 [Lasiodiplodia mahajangana]|uniref:Uncharacterized protein n=1 Tax=Lasiodiplodia mahajangana TaxID=1108764 RepID=A0ACC2JX45_9PEZI|nr:hypothetical protein O1611_g1546 [Lasiodiplodia mahajangana]
MAFAALGSMELAFDSVKYALLVADTAASPTSLRGYAVAAHLSRLFNSEQILHNMAFDTLVDSRDDAMIGTADALDRSIGARINSGAPFNTSVAVFDAALTAALTASRSGITLPSLAPGGSSCRSKPTWATEAQTEAVEARVRAGNCTAAETF